jgi:selenocysteine-specific elongation factor
MIVATAGHIDHGKTALVKALTQVDTDRLPEEKARGISIDIGFAYVQTPAGSTLGFVDVPGHERFVRNMLAGVCGIDCAMLVIAADDGVMPQTREHLAILDLLAVERGIVVITKVDCVSPERIAEVRAQVATVTASTTLAGAPLIEVSSLTGHGVGTLRAWLGAQADAYTAHVDPRRGFRYAIDRAFSVTGSGTVVTGTVFQGSVSEGDRLVLSPTGVAVRVRRIEKAGAASKDAQAGERCALNLTGVDRGQVSRGHFALAIDGATTRFDAQLRSLAHAPRPLRHWAEVHLHVGTADIVARVAIARGGALRPGEIATVQLLCNTPVAVVVGDRFIVRDPQAMHTLGGGMVLDPFPPSRRMPQEVRAAQLEAMALSEPERVLPALLPVSPGGVDLVQFARAFNLLPGYAERLARDADAVLVGDPPRALPRTTVEALKDALVATLARFHAESPQAQGIDVSALRGQIAPALSAGTFGAFVRMIAAERGVELVGSIVRRADHVATANRTDALLWQRVKPRLLEAQFRGELVRDLASDLRVQEGVLADFLHRKATTGEVIRVTPQRFYPREIMAQLAALATAMAAEAPAQAFIAAAFRDRVGVNRTVAIEILECLDRLGVTQRVGDARKIRKDFVPILGPARLPATESPVAPLRNRAREGTPRPSASRR